MLGAKLKQELLYGARNPLGQFIRVGGMRFRVIGTERREILLLFLWEAIALALFGGIVGLLLAGIAPARTAAMMNPIDALRSE